MKEININKILNTDKLNFGMCEKCNKTNIIIENFYSNIGNYKNFCINCGSLEKERLEKQYLNNLAIYFGYDKEV